ncbi:ABC transporter permease [Gordonia sp. CPCC 205515]|uniref:ABC transporter permease n=1 Tax=Gordonia sp. CPCC 205515 TaxID=3140791 RepID=UPI003AF360FF
MATADFPSSGTSSISRRTHLLRQLKSSTPVYMFGVMVLLFIAFSVLAPNAFPTLANVRNIFMDGSTLLVLAVGVTYVMVAGGIDLSIGSVLVFANVAAAKTMTAMGTDNAMTIVVGVAVALACGLGWGIFNGLCITKLRVPALITTLGTLGAVLGLANLLVDGNDISDLPSSLISLTTSHILGVSPLIWVAIIVVIIGGVVLAVTRFGRHTYVVGSNEEAARRAGINVDRHLIKLYAMSGMLAGLAGMLSLIRFDTTTLSGHTTDFIAVITGVVLGGISLFGGVGTVGGAVIGIFISTMLINGFTIINVQPFWQQVAIGFILILAVYIDQLKRRSRDRAGR